MTGVFEEFAAVAEPVLNEAEAGARSDTLFPLDRLAYLRRRYSTAAADAAGRLLTEHDGDAGLIQSLGKVVAAGTQVLDTCETLIRLGNARVALDLLGGDE